MTKDEKLVASVDEWETHKLGHDEEYVSRARKSHEESLDAALGLQMISVRLQKQLIADLKFIATAHGIGYQPLIRDVLSRFVVHEKKLIMRETIQRLELEQALLAKQAKEPAEPAPVKPKARRVA